MSLLGISFLAVSAPHEKKLTYCVDPDWFPFEAIKGGKHIGISSDYIQFIAKSIEFELKFMPTDSWQHTLDLLQNGTCHLTPMLNQNDVRSQYLRFSNSYLNSPNVLVSTKKQPFLKGFDHVGNQVVALTEGFRINDYIKNKYPDIATRTYANELAGLMSVVDGETDIFVGSMLSTNNYIQQHGLHQLRIAGWGGPEDVLRVGVIKSKGQLIPAINAALAKIDDAHHLAIYHKWNNITVIDNTNYKLVQQIMLYGGIGLFLMFCYMLMVKRYNRQLHQQNMELNRLKGELTASNERLKQLSTHDLLTGLYNRYYFDLALAEDSSRYDPHNPISLIVIDIDHFKNINDQFGHATGDLVLKQFAKVLSELVTDMDVLARWGGEEFVIFSNNTTLQQAHDKCYEVQKQLKATAFPQIIELTASFGIAAVKPEETMAMCFQRADQALYQAKAKGRNRICIADVAQAMDTPA